MYGLMHVDTLSFDQDKAVSVHGPCRPCLDAQTELYLWPCSFVKGRVLGCTQYWDFDVAHCVNAEFGQYKSLQMMLICVVDKFII